MKHVRNVLVLMLCLAGVTSLAWGQLVGVPVAPVQPPPPADELLQMGLECWDANGALIPPPSLDVNKRCQGQRKCVLKDGCLSVLFNADLYWKPVVNRAVGTCKSDPDVGPEHCQTCASSQFILCAQGLIWQTPDCNVPYKINGVQQINQHAEKIEGGIQCVEHK